MLRYLLLCISCLLLLTACGGGLTGQAKGKKDALPSFLEQGSPKSCPECDLGNADLSGADLTEANLVKANLTTANLSEATLEIANLTRAKLTGAKLTGADLTRANLPGANLPGANLDGVIGADFSGAYNVPDKYLKD